MGLNHITLIIACTCLLLLLLHVFRCCCMIVVSFSFGLCTWCWPLCVAKRHHTGRITWFTFICFKLDKCKVIYHTQSEKMCDTEITVWKNFPLFLCCCYCYVNVLPLSRFRFFSCVATLWIGYSMESIKNTSKSISYLLMVLLLLLLLWFSHSK